MNEDDSMSPKKASADEEDRLSDLQQFIEQFAIADKQAYLEALHQCPD